MGTRNLTIVYMDGEYRVSQYGQWDGYPDSAGIVALHFLRNEMNEHLFRDRLSQIKWVNTEKLTQLFYDYGGKEDGTIQMPDADRFFADYPEFSRDTGVDILRMIQNGAVKTNTLKNNIDFAADSLWCEWAWIIDLDKRTFEAYEGFNKSPLKEDDRFYFLRDSEDKKSGFHGVKLVASWTFDNLPTDEDFLAAFTSDDDEEDSY